MERKIGLLRFFASSNASSPQGRQSTGLWACWRRYGLFSWLIRFVCMGFAFPFRTGCGLADVEHSSKIETPMEEHTTYLTAGGLTGTGLMGSLPQCGRHGKHVEPRDLARFESAQAKIRLPLVAESDLI